MSTFERDTTPATERSKPFEMTTRLSPAAAMASGAALLERLVTPDTLRALGSQSA